MAVTSTSLTTSRSYLSDYCQPVCYIEYTYYYRENYFFHENKYTKTAINIAVNTRFILITKSF